MCIRDRALSLNKGNAEKYRQMIPAPLQSLINPQQCLVLSVFLRNKPVGLFYADNGTKAEITPEQFANFKAVCQRAIQRLT